MAKSPGTTSRSAGIQRIEGDPRAFVGGIGLALSVPLTTAIDDVAFPGNELAGAHLVDITVVDTSGHRRTLNAELPAHVSVTGTIVLALRRVSTHLPTVESAPRRSPLTVDGQR